MITVFTIIILLLSGSLFGVIIIPCSCSIASRIHILSYLPERTATASTYISIISNIGPEKHIWNTWGLGFTFIALISRQLYSLLLSLVVLWC